MAAGASGRALVMGAGAMAVVGNGARAADGAAANAARVAKAVGTGGAACVPATLAVASALGANTCCAEAMCWPLANAACDTTVAANDVCA